MFSASFTSTFFCSTRIRACSSRSRKTWYGLPPAERIALRSLSRARSSARRFSARRWFAPCSLACAASVLVLSASTASARFSSCLRCAV